MPPLPPPLSPLLPPPSLCVFLRFSQASTLAGARFQLDDKEYKLSANIADQHHAHGGFTGFDKVVWDAEILAGAQADADAPVGDTGGSERDGDRVQPQPPYSTAATGGEQNDTPPALAPAQVASASLSPAASGAASVRFRYVSVDGEEGYPGTMQTELTYTVTAGSNELWLEYRAVVDKPCPVNLTNHTYWNLSGDLVRGVRQHRLWLNRCTGCRCHHP